MSPEIPREWFDIAEDHARSARVILEHAEGRSTVAFLLHEAAEKALKGFLIGAGWELSKTHVLPFLSEEAARKDARFGGAHAELCARIDGYLAVRYPPFPQVPATSAELLADLAAVEALIMLARQAAKERLG